MLSVPAGLPARLAELLVARAGRCGESGQVVLAGLAVAGRPLTEDLLSEITGRQPGEVRTGLRELAAGRLLAEDTPGGGHKPRHALLAETMAAALLPAERAELHERTARALSETGDQALAAEAAGHWQAAARPAEELPARVAAAEAAERVFGYAEAAAHWQRAIELGQALPAAAETAGIGLPRMFVRAIDALQAAGKEERAGELAEEAYRRCTGADDPATAAVICARAAYYRVFEAPDAGLPLMKEALRLFAQSGPSAEHAQAWLDYAMNFLLHAKGQQQAGATALTTALKIAETAGATAIVSQILALLADDAFVRGRHGEGVAFLRRGRALAEAAGDAQSLLWQDEVESYMLLKTGDFPRAADLALRGLQATRRAGLGDSWEAAVLASNGAEALLAQGHTAEAAALIDPLTSAPPDRDHWIVHAMRTEIDLLRGEPESAAERWQQLTAITNSLGSIDFAREAAQQAAELALWTGRPGDALAEVQRAVALFHAPDLTIFFGRLLAAGMRACADLAEKARARRDQPALNAALAAASDLTAWVDQLARAPFTDHPFVAAIPAERATWDAERARLTGPSDPAAWAAAGKAWQDLGCPHRAGYAWWRQAQAQLDAGLPATATAAALRAAAAAADGHAPLLAQVRTLAGRARITLQTAPAAGADPRPAADPVLYGLTGRELAVLRLLAAGQTNAQIGAELYISPKTASVHVTSIFRKLGVSGRAQAAAVAERAGLLGDQG
jgi:DNA-binding CsgD family transcriptional regulator